MERAEALEDRVLEASECQSSYPYGYPMSPSFSPLLPTSLSLNPSNPIVPHNA